MDQSQQQISSSQPTKGEVSGRAHSASAKTERESQSVPAIGDRVKDELYQGELKLAQQKIADLTEMSKRALADLSNYKKRVEEERVQFAKFANVGLILEILPVVDNFQRAVAHLPENLKNGEGTARAQGWSEGVSKSETTERQPSFNIKDWVKGILQTEKQLLEVLKKEGIVEIPSSIGQKFDPYKHEVITQGPGEKDIILEEFESGYLLGEKLIRPAKVKVGDGSAKN